MTLTGYPMMAASPVAAQGFWLSVSRVLVQDLVDGGDDHFG